MLLNTHVLYSYTIVIVMCSTCGECEREREECLLFLHHCLQVCLYSLVSLSHMNALSLL